MTNYINYWVFPEQIAPGIPLLLLVADDNGNLINTHCLCRLGADWRLDGRLDGSGTDRRDRDCDPECPLYAESEYTIPSGAVRVCRLRFGTFDTKLVSQMVQDVVQRARFKISAEEIHISLLEKFAEHKVSDWLMDSEERPLSCLVR